MSLKLIIFSTVFVLIMKGCVSQIDGQFWWLNDKIADLQTNKPERPRFEKVSEFANDESDVIIFREESIFKNPSEIDSSVKNNANSEIKLNKTTAHINRDGASVEFKEIPKSNKNATERITKQFKETQPAGTRTEENKSKIQFQDRLTFGFVQRPREQRIAWPAARNRVETDSARNSVGYPSRVVRDNTCLCTTGEGCRRLGGKPSSNGNSSISCDESWCCVPADGISTKIIFPDQITNRKTQQSFPERARFVRSADHVTSSQQRKLLNIETPSHDRIMKRILRSASKVASDNRQAKRIVTDDEYDPYWNIKNAFSVANFSRLRNTKIVSGYGADYYDDDYTMELPRPGLRPVSSDDTPTPLDPSWSGYNKNGGKGNKNVFSEYGGGYYGTPILDPRYDQVTISTSISVKPKPKPTRAPDSEEITDEETDFQNSYSSNHNFQVFQNFKLPNLFRNRSKVKRTTERSVDYDSLEGTQGRRKPSEAKDQGEQAYPKCAEIRDDDSRSSDYGTGKALPFGSTPWLCLVVRSGARDAHAPCAATLVHPRAALTAASCVDGADDGDLTVRCGDWDLGGESEQAPQQRRAAAHAHRLYRAGHLADDIAVLYWESPLELCANVRPACLADPVDGDSCSFVGWAGADNAFRRRPSEQRAVVLSAQACGAHVERAAGTRPTRGVFCAATFGRGCALLRTIYEHPVKLLLSEDAIAPIERSAEFVERIVQEKRTTYGINTGIGLLASERVCREDSEEMQFATVVSHAVGIGAPADDSVVRLIMAMKINSLSRGYSGVRLELIRALIALVNAEVYPRIPVKGSVGASGDLAPLSHMAAVILGEGEARYKGQWVSASEGLKIAGLEPMKLAAKEGVALINATQASTAFALRGLFQAEDLYAAATVCGALTLEATLGSRVPFDNRIHEVRGHRSQTDAAAAYRHLLGERSAVSDSHRNCGKVQDPYSLRAQPQVMGACLTQIRQAADILTIEANSVNDNPLIFVDQNSVLSGANFHAETVAMAADNLALAVAEIGYLSERRISLMMDKHMSKLPPFLVENSGVNSGFMTAQVTAAALTSENKALAHPRSVDSIPTSANQEDHVSMAASAGRRLWEMADNLRGILAVEWLAACQGLDLRNGLRTTDSLEMARSLLRQRVRFLDKDRYFAPDIEAAMELLESNFLTTLMPADLLPSSCST